jgi:hypothetical protein
MYLSNGGKTACEHLDFLPLASYCLASHFGHVGSETEIVTTAVPLILKTQWLSLRRAGILRVNPLKSVAGKNDPEADILFLRDRVAQLEVELESAQRQRRQWRYRVRYTVRGRLLVLWYMDVPHRQVTKSLGIAQSTLYDWLKDVEGQGTNSSGLTFT